MLDADAIAASQFQREHYFDETGRVSVETLRIDEVPSLHNIPAPSFLKLDVQGYELAILKGASETLSTSVVGLRVECYFRRMYKEQPLFSEVEAFLRKFGFVPLGFVEMHEWRRDTLSKPPIPGASELKHSRGQLIHGDVVFMREPEDLASGQAPVEMKVCAGLVALAYEHYDIAQALFGSEDMAPWFQKHRLDWEPVLTKTAKQKVRRTLGL